MIVASTSDGCRSTFDQVEEESQKLLAKNAITRFMEKGEDSQLIVTLVERLREGIVSYQVGDCIFVPGHR